MVCVILIAEDEVVIRNMLRHILEAEGHEVLAAADGYEALELTRSYKGPIDLLITDVHMPRLNGLELIEKLAAERPGIRLLVISGKDSEELQARGSGYPFLRKPFIASTFRNKVRQILEAPPPGV